MPFHKVLSIDNANIWLWKLTESPQQLLALLPTHPHYVEEVQRFRAVQRQREWLATRVLLHRALGNNAQIVYDVNGAPHLAGRSLVAPSEVSINSSQVLEETSRVSTRTSEGSINSSQLLEETSQVPTRTSEISINPSQLLEETSQVPAGTSEVSINSSQVWEETSQVLEELSHDTERTRELFDCPRLSISHSGAWVALALSPSDCAIGIDLEMISEKAARVRDKFLTPTEQQLLSPKFSPTLLWCAKEAAYKLCNEKGLLFLDQMVLHEKDGRLCVKLPTLQREALIVTHSLEDCAFALAKYC